MFKRHWWKFWQPVGANFGPVPVKQPDGMGSLRYDLSKVRVKGLVEKIPRSRRYQLTSQGYRLCVAYLKLFEKFYTPLTSAIIRPFASDAQIPTQKLTTLDALYLGVKTALDNTSVSGSPHE